MQASPPTVGPESLTAELPLPPAEYYTTDRLTRPPHIDVPPQLEYPESSAYGGSGVVILQLWISTLGTVSDVIVERTEVASAVTENTVSAFREARFHPGQINGINVRSLMRVEVFYERVGAPIILRLTDSPP